MDTLQCRSATRAAALLLALATTGLHAASLGNIYIPEKSLGVRIEDMAVVTETGARWMSDGLPRTADDIERWMASRGKR